MDFHKATDKELWLAHDPRATMLLHMRMNERLLASLGESTDVARNLVTLTRWLIGLTVVLGIVGIGAIIAPFIAQ